jgi:D-psicose/D-tagatose/L-ribulose 3-epimerase
MSKLGSHTFIVASEWHSDDMAGKIPFLYEHGLRLIEIPLLRPAEFDPVSAREVAAAAGIELTCSLGLPEAIDANRDLDEALGFLSLALETAHAFGSKVLTGVTYSTIGRTTGSAPTEAELETVCRLMEGATRKADTLGMSVGMEPCNRYETHLLNTARDARAIIDRVGRDNLFIHLDTYHMNIEEEDFTSACETAGDRLQYIHLSESNRGVPGRGTVDWDGVMQGLTNAGFTGPLTVEAFNYLHPDIARALAVWRPVADNPDDVVTEGFPMLIEKAEAFGLSVER